MEGDRPKRKERCERCKEPLTVKNCKLITHICDRCLEEEYVKLIERESNDKDPG